MIVQSIDHLEKGVQDITNSYLSPSLTHNSYESSIPPYNLRSLGKLEKGILGARIIRLIVVIL
jgi:hypothetical protein